MPQAPEVLVSGRVVTTVLTNVRHGAPNRQAAIVRKVEAGTTIDVAAIAAGEAVAGNSQWYRSGDSYLWSGGCGPFQTSAAPLIPGGTPVTFPVTSSTPLPPVPRVIDLYHGDGVVSFEQAYDAGLRGVIHKATTGATGRDDAYKSRRHAARSAGLLWGAYHWGTAAPIEHQLDNFLSWAEPDGDTLVALDYEPTIGNQMTLEQARQFLQGISNRLHRKAVIYSGHTLKQALGTTNDAFFGAHRLWLAQYGSHPKLQASWSTYWLWQYTDGKDGPVPRTVPGIAGNSKGELDCDHYAGTDEQLTQEWAGS